MTAKKDTARHHLPHGLYWASAFAVFFGIVWLLRPMLLPFVMAMVIAYFLNPVVDSLTKHKVPRWLGTFGVLLSFVLLVVLLLVLIVPLLQSQIVALIGTLPGIVDKIREHVIPWIEQWTERLSPEDIARLQDAAGQLAGSATTWAGKIVKEIISEGAALFNLFALAIITPVVAFYLLRDWPLVTRAIDTYLPRKYHMDIRQILKDIDRALSGFLRGQALVCLCLGAVYSIGLSLTGLKYGVAIGIIGGLLSFVPYVGSTFVLVTSLILGFIQFDNYMDLGWVVLVFVIGQTLEGYVLTPKLVGDRVGLHPVWILFALFAGGALFGFVGLIIAVPVAAIIGVLARFALRQYRNSRFYHHD